MLASSSAVELSNVSKSFGETRALIDCSFSARSGEVHAIVGENGSGKSTLAKIISGVLQADSGLVKVLGGTPRSPIEARKLGAATIFQEVLVADDASIVDNLYVGYDSMLRHAMPLSQKEQEARSLMRRFTGVDIDPQARVGNLPLSIKQWIVIGRAMIQRPRVLVLDESSAALDLDATVRLHEEIGRLREGGAAVLIVTHRIAELVRIADRATILRDGRTVGVLEKADINERNLLALMTPQDRHLEGAHQDRRARLTFDPHPVITTTKMRTSARGRPIDFRLDAGTIVGLIGLDGQGQSEFVAAVAGIKPPHTGLPLVHLRDDLAFPIRHLADAETRQVCYVSGDRKREGIFPNLSIFENLAIGLYRRNLGPLGWIRRGVLAASFSEEMRRLSIKIGRPTDRITSLSGGNQQKVLVGRAFASRPSVIVLNDPARGVDLATKRDLYRELRAFADSGGAVIYLSSEIEEFLGFADRVDVFVEGGIFRSLAGVEITEERMLAAMFGQADQSRVVFDAQQSVA